MAGEEAGQLRAVALERLARVAADTGAAIKLFEQAKAEAGDDLALHVTIEQGLAGAKWVTWSDVPDVSRHLRRALRLADELADDRTLIRVLGALVWVQAFLGAEHEPDLLERALRLRDSGRHLPLTDDPRWTQANVSAWTDDLVQARLLLERLRDEAVARDEEGALAMCLHMLGKVEWRLGRWADARLHINQSEELARDLELDTIRAFALEKQVLLAVHCGDIDTAQSKATESLALAAWTETSVRHSLGVLALSRGAVAEAYRELEPVSERVWAAGVREPTHLRELTNTVEALVGLGEEARAAALLTRFENEAIRLGRVSGLALANRCRGLLAAAAGEFERAEAAFAEALRQHRELEEPLELARTLLAFGSVQRRAKRRAESRELLERAVSIFEQLGSRLWAERARAELARIGGRARSQGGLTVSERQLADLVAKGLSNKEIAAALFVTPKTVGTKLSRIYAKVGVHSRTELVHRLGERVSKV